MNSLLNVKWVKNVSTLKLLWSQLASNTVYIGLEKCNYNPSALDAFNFISNLDFSQPNLIRVHIGFVELKPASQRPLAQVYRNSIGVSYARTYRILSLISLGRGGRDLHKLQSKFGISVYSYKSLGFIPISFNGNLSA